MTTYQVPANPKIYHIAHVDRLTSILSDGRFWCDAQIIQRIPAGTVIGMGSIKQRRLSLPVSCHPGTSVGDYVPFYFCPRSIMLYVIHCANHPELAYRGGQGPIVHFEADLQAVIGWANENQQRWAFSLSNAGAVYTKFRSDVAQLGDVNWPAVSARDFRSPDIKEGKQAEFLLSHAFPWELVTSIGVHSRAIAQQVSNALLHANHRPPVQIQPYWYF